MRKVIVRERWDLNNSLLPAGEATFLAFGIGFEEFNAGIAQYSAAIIEHSDGRVELVHPSLIRFVPESKIEKEME
jgi:hypothetical protein